MRSEIIERDLAKDWAFAVVYRAVTSLKKITKTISIQNGKKK